jgi:hypothetical protein
MNSKHKVSKITVKEISPYEIVEKSVSAPQDPKRIYAALLEITKQPNYRILRHNNTLLLINNKGNGVADGVLFPADSQNVIVENLQNFAKALKVGKFNTLTMTIPNLKFVEVAKKAKLNYTVRQQGLGSFLVTVSL